MSAFTTLPQDVLQYVMSPFLDPLSRTTFNTVTKPDERVYKKFPADYALKHAILTAHKAYHTIVSELNYNLDNIGGGVVDARGISFEEKCVKGLWRLFNFFKNPHNSLIFMHKTDWKKQCISVITLMTRPDMDLYYYLDPYVIADLRTAAASVLAHIEAVADTGRSMTLKTHKSIY
jgi:hypothetical protein